METNLMLEMVVRYERFFCTNPFLLTRMVCLCWFRCPPGAA